MTAAAGQLGLTLRPPRPVRPTRPAGERAVSPRLKLALRLLLEAHHEGRENSATWEQLQAELAERGLVVGVVRRLQEAAAELRRKDKLAIGGDSQAGIYIIRTEQERRLTLAERVKRLRAEAKEIEVLDRALYERIAGVLPMEEPTP